MTSCKVVSIESNSQDILWCFEPLFTWMRMIGFELDPRFRKRFNLYGLLILLAHQWSGIDIMINSFLSLYKQPNNSNYTKHITTIDWNNKLDCANHFIFIGVVSTHFFYIAHHRWNSLWSAAKKLESAYYRFDYIRLRRLFFAGFIPLLVVRTKYIQKKFGDNQAYFLKKEIAIITYTLLFLFSDFSKKSIYKKLVTVLTFYSKIVPISVVILYCSVSWLISLFYESILEDVNKTNKVNKYTIRKWKYSMALASELIHHINQCFGMILLISITHIFIDLIAYSFYIVNSISLKTKADLILVVTNMLSKFLILWFVAYAPEKICRNVSDRYVIILKN